MSQQKNQKSLKQDKKAKSQNKYLRFTFTAFQMGGTIFLGNYIGKWLDAEYDKSFYETVVTLFSVFVSMYLVISQVVKISNKDD